MRFLFPVAHRPQLQINALKTIVLDYPGSFQTVEDHLSRVVVGITAAVISEMIFQSNDRARERKLRFRAAEYRNKLRPLLLDLLVFPPIIPPDKLVIAGRNIGDYVVIYLAHYLNG